MPPRVSSAPGASETGIGATSQLLKEWGITVDLNFSAAA
jgi:hypothetical protein